MLACQGHDIFDAVQQLFDAFLFEALYALVRGLRTVFLPPLGLESSSFGRGFGFGGGLFELFLALPVAFAEREVDASHGWGSPGGSLTERVGRGDGRGCRRRVDLGVGSC